MSAVATPTPDRPEDGTDAVPVGSAGRLAEETGAQVAEYAMLGGVSAAACTALIIIFRNPDTLARVVGAIVKWLVKAITGWEL